MADISKLSRLLNGVQRSVDLAANTLVTNEVKVGGAAGSVLTDSILTNLIALQNGSDFADGTNSHTHDGRYFTETELSSTGAASGADLIGVNNTPANYSASAQTIQDHLEGIDTALATAGGTAFSDSAFRIQDNVDATKEIAFEASAITTATTRTITMPDANVNLGDIATNASTLTNKADLTTLASNANGQGASLIGVEDAGANFTATDVEGVLAELQSNIGAVDTGANDTLSNLVSPTAINQDLLPASAQAIGSASSIFSNVHSSQFSMYDTGGTLAVRLRDSGGPIALTIENDAFLLRSAGLLEMTTDDDAGTTSGVDITTGNSSGGNSGNIRLISGTAFGNRGIVRLDGGTVTLASDNPINITGSQRISNLGDPTLPQDAATKSYVDSSAAGLDPKESVRVATAAALPANTSGGSGVGKTLTGSANGALTVDGINVQSTNRVLVKNEADLTNNGIYTVTFAGDGSNPYVLTRATDLDGSPAAEVSSGNFTFVEAGSINASSGWVLQGVGQLTVDTDNLVWVQFSDVGQVSAGDGLSKTGSTLDVVVADIAGAGLEDDGFNNLAIAASAAGSGIALAAGVLSIDFAEFNSDDITEGIANLFLTSAERSKLAGVETGATADQNAAEVPVADAAANFTATDVEGVLAELQGNIDANAGANTQLSNLAAATALNSTLDPDASVTYDLGSAARQWRQVFAQDYFAYSLGQLKGSFSGGSVLTTLRAEGVNNLRMTAPSGRTVTVESAAGTGGTDTGAVSLLSGDGTSGSGSGDILIESGFGDTDSGDVSLIVGGSNGTQGNFKFLKTGQAPTVGQVWTASAVDGAGYWADAAGTAADISYDNTSSGLTATTTQAAIDEVEARVDTLEANTDASTLVEDFTLGEGVTAGLKAVRMAKAADSVTLGRVMLADINASSVDNFYVVGLVAPTVTISVGNPITTVKAGSITSTAHGLTVGEPFYLGASGGLTSTAPSGTDEAIVKCGTVRDANTLEVQIQVIGVA